MGVPLQKNPNFSDFSDKKTGGQSDSKSEVGSFIAITLRVGTFCCMTQLSKWNLLSEFIKDLE